MKPMISTTCLRCPGIRDRRMKGSQDMRIAIPYEQGEIFRHFGHHEHHGGDCGHDHCAEHNCRGN